MEKFECSLSVSILLILLFILSELLRNGFLYHTLQISNNNDLCHLICFDQALLNEAANKV